ncbi:MAG: hypothetical protein K6D94_11925 [Clostridiales bacterium]|nr:hypothetical protein [Clostridiales bacterium]
MLSVSYAENSTLTNHYEYRADKKGIPVLIEGPAGETDLLKLSVLSTGSDEDTLYQADKVYTLDMLDKPPIATIDVGSIFPRYGISTGGKTYGIVNHDKELSLVEVKTVPKINTNTGI